MTGPNAELLRRGLHALRRSGRWWGLGIAVFALVNVAFWPSLEGSDAMQAFDDMGSLLEAFGAQDLGTPAGYLDGQMYALMLPLLLSGMAVAHVTALTSGEKLTDSRPASQGAGGGGKVKLFKTREEKRAEAMAREAQAKARKELEKNVVVAEAAIATAELKLKNLTIELEKPQTYADGGRALRLNRDVMATQEEIARLTEAWEKALARVEATNSAD